MSLKRLKRW